MIYGIDLGTDRIRRFFSPEEIEEFLFGMTDWDLWDRWVFFNGDSGRRISWRDQRVTTPQSLLAEIRHMLGYPSQTTEKNS